MNKNINQINIIIFLQFQSHELNLIAICCQFIVIVTDFIQLHCIINI